MRRQQQPFIKGFVKTKKIIKTPSTQPSPNSTVTTCACHGRLHPLNLKTPNCLKCGFILCIENISGFCPYCKEPLSIDPALKEDPEYMAANENLARLLSYQGSGALRTRIHDEVGDFQTGGGGEKSVGQWGTKEEQEYQKRMEEKAWKKLEKKELMRNGRAKKKMAFDIGLNKMVEIEDSSSSDSEDEKKDVVYGFDRRFAGGEQDSSHEPSKSEPSSSFADPEISKRQKHHKKQLIVPQYKSNKNEPVFSETLPIKNDLANENSTRLQMSEEYADAMAFEY